MSDMESKYPEEDRIRSDKGEREEKQQQQQQQGQFPYDASIKKEQELLRKFESTDYDTIDESHTPLQQLEKIGHDATLIQEERIQRAKAKEKEEDSKWWAEEHKRQETEKQKHIHPSSPLSTSTSSSSSSYTKDASQNKKPLQQTGQITGYKDSLSDLRGPSATEFGSAKNKMEASQEDIEQQHRAQLTDLPARTNDRQLPQRDKEQNMPQRSLTSPKHQEEGGILSNLFGGGSKRKDQDVKDQEKWSSTDRGVLRVEEREGKPFFQDNPPKTKDQEENSLSNNYGPKRPPNSSHSDVTDLGSRGWPTGHITGHGPGEKESLDRHKQERKEFLKEIEKLPDQEFPRTIVVSKEEAESGGLDSTRVNRVNKNSSTAFNPVARMMEHMDPTRGQAPAQGSGVTLSNDRDQYDETQFQELVGRDRAKSVADRANEVGRDQAVKEAFGGSFSSSSTDQAARDWNDKTMKTRLVLLRR